jgi:hypothetical protein
MNIITEVFLSALFLSSPLWLAVIIGTLKSRREAKENQVHDMIENAMREGYDWGYEKGYLDAELEKDPNYTPSPSPFSYWNIGYNNPQHQGSEK